MTDNNPFNQGLTIYSHCSNLVLHISIVRTLHKQEQVSQGNSRGKVPSQVRDDTSNDRLADKYKCNSDILLIFTLFIFVSLLLNCNH